MIFSFFPFFFDVHHSNPFHVAQRRRIFFLLTLAILHWVEKNLYSETKKKPLPVMISPKRLFFIFNSHTLKAKNVALQTSDLSKINLQSLENHKLFPSLTSILQKVVGLWNNRFYHGSPNWVTTDRNVALSRL